MGRVVAAAVYSAGKKVTDITLDEGAAWAAKPGHFVWIGLEEPNAQELANLQRQFNLHELAIEDALEKHSRPKLETFGDALFIVTYSPVRENGKLEFIETHIFAGNGYIITARNGHSASYGFVRQRCEARPLLLEHGEDFVLYALLDFVTENYQPVSEAIHAEIDELEHNVLCSSLSERDIQKIHGLRRDVLRLKRYVAPMGGDQPGTAEAELPVYRQEHAPVFPGRADPRHAADGRPHHPARYRQPDHRDRCIA